MAKETTQRKKTGLLIRLSNLIILQVIFVFAAIALLIFSPRSDSEAEDTRESTHNGLNRLAGQIAEINLRELDDTRLRELVSKADLLIHRTKLFRVAATGQIDMIGQWTQPSGEQSTVVSHIPSEPGLLNIFADGDYPDHLSVAYSPAYTLHYVRVTGDTASTSVVLEAVVGEDVIVSSRADLQYGLFVLFLVSTLLSLLIVYLIVKRLKTPIERLIRGMEKTAQGELYYMVEAEADAELDRLGEAYNKMARTLWQNQQSLKLYNARLKRSNVKLIESQVFLSTLVNCSPYGVIVTGADGRIILANSAVTDLFEIDNAELIGQDLSDMLVVGEAAPESDDAGEDSKLNFEAVCRRGSDDHFPAFVLMRPVVVAGDTRAFLYIINDISESKSFQEMMVRLDRYYTRGEMAGDIAHEINNYLAILSGNVELMPLLLKKGDPEKIDKKLNVMKSTVDKITHFANGLMDAPHDKLQVETSSLNQVVENVIAFLKPQNKFDDIDIRVSLAADLPFLEYDTGQVQQVLVNLVYNAADALAQVDGERVVTIRTALVDRNGEEYGRVEVCDNGPGVNPNNVESLFQNRFTTKRKGHGIGLITCRKIIEAHGGRVAYEYRDGAAFSFEIPRRPAIRNEASAEHAATTPAT